ncbi:MAG: hypothetical protein IJX81_05200 [Clostridia bacterium]|nr:hypothetical protein [Clostridia bacterium]
MTEKRTQRKSERKKHYRPWIGFALFWVRLFTRKRKVEGKLVKGPCVYLCRHRGDDGVIGSFTSLKTVLRPWALHIFTDRKLAIKHFKEFTFSQKAGKGKLFTTIFSPICGWGLSSLVKSARAIPVYRGAEARKSIVTIKNSVRALEEGDQLLVFPDVDYADESEQKNGEIYKGFASVDTLYFRRNQERVKFVPIYLTKEKIVIHEPVTFGEGTEEETLERIVKGIYNE